MRAPCWRSPSWCWRPGVHSHRPPGPPDRSSDRLSTPATPRSSARASSCAATAPTSCGARRRTRPGDTLCRSFRSDLSTSRSKPPDSSPRSRPSSSRMGTSVSANFTLRVAGVAESVDVVRPTESTGAQGKAVLTDLQLQGLPASGRRVRSLFLFTPATQIEPECGGFAISGQKGVYTNINVDGNDYTNTHWCGHVEFSPTFSIEALQEFQVIRSTLLRGVRTLDRRHRQHVHQVGLEPAARNRLLPVPQRRDDTAGPFRPAADRRRSAVRRIAGRRNQKRPDVLLRRTGVPAQHQAGRRSSTRRSTLRTSATRPPRRTLLGVAPEGDTQALSQSQSIVSRIDHHLGDRHTLMGRFDYVRNLVTDNVGSVVMTQGLGADSITNRALSNQALLTNRNDVTGAAQASSVLSSRFLNEARAQITHEYRPWNNGTGGPEVTVKNAGATVAIYGPQATGLSYGNIGYQFSDVRMQFVDNVSFVTGAHTAKVGVDLDTVNGKTTFNPGSNGIYTFNSLADYVGAEGVSVSAVRAAAATSMRACTQLAFYAQDEWRLRSGLTISPGLRYEQAYLPDYAAPTVAREPVPARHGDPQRQGPDRAAAGHHVGSVQQRPHDRPRGRRDLLRRAVHAGVRAVDPRQWRQSRTEQRRDVSRRARIPTPCPTRSARSASTWRPRISRTCRRSPRRSSISWSRRKTGSARRSTTSIRISVCRARPSSASRSSGSSGAASRPASTSRTSTPSRIARVRNINLAPPVADATGRPIYTAARPYGPQFGVVQVTESTAHSNYHGVTASLSAKRRRFSVRRLLHAGLQPSSADDTERGISGVVFDDAYNLANEYNWSNIDQRHQFAGDGLLSLPWQLDLSTTVRVNFGPSVHRAGRNRSEQGRRRCATGRSSTAP